MLFKKINENIIDAIENKKPSLLPNSIIIIDDKNDATIIKKSVFI
ncbi:MAG: hypothetical protein R3Y64_05175 [Peptostreptococcaceae bacterium]